MSQRKFDLQSLLGLSDEKFLLLNLRSEMTAMMLCGELDWSKGCYLKSLSDEELLKLYNDPPSHP